MASVRNEPRQGKGSSNRIASVNVERVVNKDDHQLATSKHFDSVDDSTTAKNMENLGKAGDIVKVAPGYFRNYLMPKLLAVPNIDKFAYLMREQRKIYQPKEAEEVKVEKETKQDLIKEYIDAAKRLDNGKLVSRRIE